MTAINPDWDTIINPIPSTSTQIGGTWAVLLSSLLNGLDIELMDASKVPLIGTSFYFKSNKLRIQDEEGSHHIKFVLDNIDEGNNKTLRIRPFTIGDVDYILTENEPATLASKTINATNNAISNLTNTNIASSAAIAWDKIDRTGSKLEDMENVHMDTILSGQSLEWDESLDKWMPYTPFVGTSSLSLIGGSALRSGNGTNRVFVIAHGMSSSPTSVTVTPGTNDALGAFKTEIDNTNITITYGVAPPTGTNNLTFFWTVSNSGGGIGTVVYTGQENTYTAHNQTFTSGYLRLASGAFVGILQSPLTASRIWTIPDGTGTVLLDTLAQTMTNKTINVDENTIKHSTTNTAGRLLKSNGTKFDSLAIGAANRFLAVNAAGNDLEWVAGQKAVTINNLGITGEGILKQITAAGELQAYNIENGSNKITITKDLVDNVIFIDVDPSSFTLSTMTGTLPYSKLALGGNVKDVDILAHTSTKISIVDKTKLNANIVYTDVNTNFGDFEYKFKDNRLFINNPSDTYAYQFIASAITSNRAIFLPLLTGDEFMVTSAAIQTLTNKTLTAPKISSIVNGAATLTLPSASGELALTSDPRFINIGVTVATHAGKHAANGTDPVHIDVIGSGTDITTNNATTAKHGLLMKLSTTPLALLRINSAGTGMEWALPTAEKRGASTASGNASTTVFNVPHGLGSNPAYAMIRCSSLDLGFTYTTTSTNIVVTFTTAPASGTNNVVFYWHVAAS